MSKLKSLNQRKSSTHSKLYTGERAFYACHFPTAIGECAIIWDDQEQVCGFLLPEAQIKNLKNRIQEWPALLVPTSKLPHSLSVLIKKIEKHLKGEVQDFSQVKISLSRSTEFQRKIYLKVKAIPAGELCSYKDLGQALGGLKAFRAIGSAMGKNPIPLIVPCHRVVGSGKYLGGFTAHGGVSTKLKLLSLEGFNNNSFKSDYSPKRSRNI